MISGLTVSHEESPIFSSNGKWLHPLFDLEDFLAGREFLPEKLNLRDKIIGKAAAMLIVRLGIVHVTGILLSERALAFFRSRGIEPSWETLVPMISCRTETILADIDDIQQAYKILCMRAGRDSSANVL